MAENYYQILGIGVRASEAEVKAAYKQLAKKFHPDVNKGSVEHEEKFKKILEAYQTLSDAEKKKRYDLKLFYTAITDSVADSAPDPVYRNVPKTPREREEERYRSRSGSRQFYRDFAGPAQSRRITPNVIAIALLVVSSFVMISYWMGFLMNRHMAQQCLEQGDFSRALEYDDEYAEAYFARYQFFAVRKFPREKLLKDLNLAIGFADEPQAEWLLCRARLFTETGKIIAATDDFLAAKRAGPGIDSVWQALGNHYLNVLNKPEMAVSRFDTALLIRKNYYPALLGKAIALYRLKRFAAANAFFSICIASGRAEREVFYMRGASLLALAREKEACEDLNQALNMGFLEAKPLVDRYCPESY